MTPISTSFETLLDGLCDKGFAVYENFLPAEQIQLLANLAIKRHANDEMKNAKIGKTNKNLNQDIRGDLIDWLDESDAEACIQAYFYGMHALKQAINQNLFMNLHALEAHMAIYPTGHVYKKHLDQFADGENTRELSCILYLNENWQADEGGELRLYLDDNHIDILPEGGKLVLFLSAKFWHEVLPAKRHRISLTGWFHTPKKLLL
jgi:SM-20-related protein